MQIAEEQSSKSQPALEKEPAEKDLPQQSNAMVAFIEEHGKTLAMAAASIAICILLLKTDAGQTIMSKV